MKPDDNNHFKLVAGPPKPLTDEQMDGPITVVVTMMAALLTIIIIAIWVFNMMAIPVA